MPVFPLLLATTLGAFASAAPPGDVAKNLALYSLYPQEKEGLRALANAQKLLDSDLARFASELSSYDLGPEVSRDCCLFVQQLATQLGLVPTETDFDVAAHLAAATEPDPLERLRFLAKLDWLALQIYVLTPKDASPSERIGVLNDFLFSKVGFRFPPLSQFSERIDEYTFLSRVLTSRRGVCLGVSTLYLALSQRLHLPLEMITPPGHIYVRYRDANTTINIETTARGIDLPSKRYLSVGTRSLQQRTAKEVVGMSFYNEASVYLAKDPAKSVVCYEKAKTYIEGDLQLELFYGFALWLAGDTRAEAVLSALPAAPLDFEVSPNSLLLDYKDGLLTKELLQELFAEHQEDRISLEKRLANLQKHKPSRSGLMALASCQMQLMQNQAAIGSLRTLAQLDPGDVECQYYLAALYTDRKEPLLAQAHLRQATALCEQRQHQPEALRELSDNLFYHYGLL